jgi:hypothetical protein
VYSFKQSSLSIPTKDAAIIHQTRNAIMLKYIQVRTRDATEKVQKKDATEDLVKTKENISNP